MATVRTGTSIGKHNEAIMLADAAHEAKRLRRYKTAKDLFAKAYDLERFAGETISDDKMRYSLYLNAAVYARLAELQQEETWMRERVEEILQSLRTSDCVDPRWKITR